MKNDDRLNTNSGAVVLGHPVEMTGVRSIGTLAYELRRCNMRYDITCTCTGGGMVIALMIENVN